MILVDIRCSIFPQSRSLFKWCWAVTIGKLSRLINALVIDKLDHKNLNLDVEFMKGKMASTEVLAITI